MGNPRPIISWEVDGELLQPSSRDPLETRFWQISDRYSIGSYDFSAETISHVNISNLRVEDSGLYKCTASNLLATVVHSARLNVYGKWLLFSLCTRLEYQNINMHYSI